MNEIKVSLNIVLPGSVMLSKEECLKTTQKTIEKKNKVGKPYKQTIKITAEDWNKVDKNTLKVTEKGKNPEIITFYTRKCIPASQTINLTKEAYNYMISKESFVVGFKPSKWVTLSKKEKLEAHLSEITKFVGGLSYTYQVFED